METATAARLTVLIPLVELPAPEAVLRKVWLRVDAGLRLGEDGGCPVNVASPGASLLFVR